MACCYHGCKKAHTTHAMAAALSHIRSLAEVLDALGVAICVFDDADNSLLWNRSFLAFFPEHDGHIHVGEPYRANLRRFYLGRLAAHELPEIERYIDAGIARHRAQQHAYSFEHRNRRLLVASLPLAGIGRVRIWRPEEEAADNAAQANRGPEGGAAAVEDADVFEHLAEGVLVTADGRAEFANQSFALMYRLYGREAAIGHTLQDIYRLAWREASDAEPARFALGLQALAENMRYSGSAFELPLPEGRWSRVVAEHRPGGRVYSVHGDITPLKLQQVHLIAAERRARESEAGLREKSALLEATLERMEQGVIMVNAQRVVEVCNSRAIELLGLSAELMASRPNYDDVLAAQWAAGEFAHSSPDIQELVRNGGIMDRPHKYDRKRPDGRIVEIQSIPFEGGGVLRTYTDITERRLREERIRHVAQHDGLTSLVNREVFLERLRNALLLQQRSATSEGCLAVHFIDLDRFKPVNDRWGHAAGDKVLAAVASRMRALVREQDVVARLGGDEFAILQCNVRDAESAVQLARRTIEAITQPIDVGGHSVEIGASTGIAMHPQDGADADTLLRHADAAMYRAKNGRLQVCLHAGGASQ